MSIKKYFADSDTTITNAAGIKISTRGTGSNSGQSDILETFTIKYLWLQFLLAKSSTKKKGALI